MDHQMIRVLDALCEEVGTPRALAVKLLAHAGEWAQLQQLRCVASDYVVGCVRNREIPDAEAYWRDNLVTDFLRKCDLPTSVDKEAAAVQTFMQCERANCTTNARLSRYLPESLFIEEQDLPVYEFITRWRKEVISVMGNLPDDLTPRFSGGATFADTGLLTTTPDKMSSIPTIYAGTRDLLPLWHETAWSRALVRERPWQSDPRTVRGNIFFTVPKDGTKFRGCAKESSINVTYQLAVGSLLKGRLERINIDLRLGKQIHMALAKQASRDQSLATIDMSNASDTLCRILVRLLVRGDWYELLDSLRATHTRVNGKWYRLEKFSSMGNGFTFEIETVVFATLARCVIRDAGGDPDVVKCYGDDLIVPAIHYREVVAALRLFGFEPNMKKTFWEGPFRESCGGDYFDGVPVRAHYVESLPDEPQHWMSLANGLRRVSRADGVHPSRWGVCRRAWFRCLDAIPADIRRCRGPEHLGDIVIHDDPGAWSVRDAKGGDPSWDATYIRAYIPLPIVLPWDHWLPTVQLACCTLGLPSAGITPRKGVSGYRIGVVVANLTSSWLPSPLTPSYRRSDDGLVCTYSPL